MDLQQGIIPRFFLIMKKFQIDLIEWYIQNHRPLEFRLKKDPYEIWISEIMAQQTRIEAMLPYFKRWIQQLPDIESVAKCDDEKLNKLWQGLGYYSRCKNIKKCAIECVEKYEGKLPCTKEELLKLPGIGPYTAGAIASIAYGQRVSAIDGNVIRVFSRLYNICEDVTKTNVKKKIEKLVDESLPSKEEISYYNQALMELGALICIPKSPSCDHCPIQKYCSALDPASLPYKPKKKARKIEYKHVYIWMYQNKVHVVKRADTGLLAGLYGFDEVKPEHIIESIELEPYIHIFSHVEWHMDATLCIVDREDSNYKTVEEIEERVALPSAFMPFMNQVKEYLWKK